MAQYSATAIQDVAVNQNVLFDDSYPCNKGYVIHQTGSGVFTLRGATQQRCAKYRVTFSGNIAGTAAGPLMLALTLNGETLFNAVAMSQAAAADEYNNVNIDVVIAIPCGCCFSLAVRNIGTIETSVSNSNLIIERIC